MVAASLPKYTISAPPVVATSAADTANFLLLAHVPLATIPVVTKLASPG